jgi:hypothetical protein
MKNTITKLLAVVTFGLILSSSVMAGEDVDALTLSFQNNSVSTSDVHISNVSYTPGIVSSDSVLGMCYDSIK